MAVAGGSDVEDLGEDYRRGDQLAETARTGPMPILVRASDPDDQIDRIAEMIEEMAALEDPIEPGDVAVLALWRNRVGKIEKLLKAQGCRVQKLDNYDGRPNDRIKIGTYHRAKGLEFKAVFPPT